MSERLPSLPLFVDDYEAATAHLSIEEDGVYMRLLRLCWRTPRCSIPDEPEWIARKLRIDRDTFERVAMPIIAEFFSRARGRIYQKRLLQEFVRANEQKQRRREAGKRGGAAKAQKVHDNSSSNATVLLEATPKQRSSSRAGTQPQPHIPTKVAIGAGALNCPEEVEDQVWRDFLAIRKAKRAPMTETALANIASQAGTAGWSLNDALAECVARGWQGFKAEWVTSRGSIANGASYAPAAGGDFLDHKIAQRREREEWERQRERTGGGVE